MVDPKMLSAYVQLMQPNLDTATKGSDANSPYYQKGESREAGASDQMLHDEWSKISSTYDEVREKASDKKEASYEAPLNTQAPPRPSN